MTLRLGSTLSTTLKTGLLTTGLLFSMAIKERGKLVDGRFVDSSFVEAYYGERGAFCTGVTKSEEGDRLTVPISRDAF